LGWFSGLESEMALEAGLQVGIVGWGIWNSFWFELEQFIVHGIKMLVTRKFFSFVGVDLFC
jgi:hypothetical protein